MSFFFHIFLFIGSQSVLSALSASKCAISEYLRTIRPACITITQPVIQSQKFKKLTAKRTTNNFVPSTFAVS